MDTRIARDSDLSLTSNPSARRPTVTAAPLCVAHINRAPSFPRTPYQRPTSFPCLDITGKRAGLSFLRLKTYVCVCSDRGHTFPTRRPRETVWPPRSSTILVRARRERCTKIASQRRPLCPVQFSPAKSLPVLAMRPANLIFFHLCMNEIFPVIVVTLTRYNLTPLLLHSNGHHPPCHTVTRSYRMVAQAHKQGR